MKKYIKNTRSERYNIICSIDAHEKQIPSSIYDGISGGSNTIQLNLKIEALASLGATFYFIDCWLKCFDKNYQDR